MRLTDPIRIGDLVCKLNGHAPMKVMRKVHGETVRVAYLSSLRSGEHKDCGENRTRDTLRRYLEPGTPVMVDGVVAEWVGYMKFRAGMVEVKIHDGTALVDQNSIEIPEAGTMRKEFLACLNGPFMKGDYVIQKAGVKNPVFLVNRTNGNTIWVLDGSGEETAVNQRGWKLYIEKGTPVKVHTEDGWAHGRFETHMFNDPIQCLVMIDGAIMTCHLSDTYLDMEKEKTMPKQDDVLYRLPDDKYGEYMATEKDGRYVMKIQGSGEYKAYSPDDVEEVLPWTFLVAHITGDYANRHYVAPENSVKQNDHVLLTVDSQMVIGRVTAVNTKDRGAAKFTGLLLQTKELEEPK